LRVKIARIPCIFPLTGESSRREVRSRLRAPPRRLDCREFSSSLSAKLTNNVSFEISAQRTGSGENGLLHQDGRVWLGFLCSRNQQSDFVKLSRRTLGDRKSMVCRMRSRRCDRAHLWLPPVVTPERSHYAGQGRWAYNRAIFEVKKEIPG
jgi:hypothetical protein